MRRIRTVVLIFYRLVREGISDMGTYKQRQKGGRELCRYLVKGNRKQKGPKGRSKKTTVAGESLRDQRRPWRP